MVGGMLMNTNGPCCSNAIGIDQHSTESRSSAGTPHHDATGPGRSSTGSQQRAPDDDDDGDDDNDDDNDDDDDDEWIGIDFCQGSEGLGSGWSIEALIVAAATAAAAAVAAHCLPGKPPLPELPVGGT